MLRQLECLATRQDQLEARLDHAGVPPVPADSKSSPLLPILCIVVGILAAACFFSDRESRRLRQDGKVMENRLLAVERMAWCGRRRTWYDSRQQPEPPSPVEPAPADDGGSNQGPLPSPDLTPGGGSDSNATPDPPEVPPDAPDSPTTPETTQIEYVCECCGQVVTKRGWHCIPKSLLRCECYYHRNFRIKGDPLPDPE